MNEIRTCPSCGRALETGALSGLCANCLFRSGVDRLLQSLETDQKRSFGDYQLLEEIGRGGMGVVYRAKQLSLQRVVAVKMILYGQFAGPNYSIRLRSEATVAANLRHRNIVGIYEIGEHEGQAFLAMEFVDGKSLAEIVEHEPLEPMRAARLVRIIAEAIHLAHRQGVFHRDLKPSNILLDSEDQPHVTDFGLAKRLDLDSDLTLSGQPLGTPSFMPPEQVAMKKNEIGPWSDIYSLGAVLYHLLVGRPPFVADSLSETFNQILNQEPTSPTSLNSDVPADLATICLKCLEKEPRRRYSSAAEFATDLSRFERGDSVLARPLTSTERMLRLCKRSPVITSLAILALVSILGGVTISLSQAKRADRFAAAEKAARAEEKTATLEKDREALRVMVRLTERDARNAKLHHAMARTAWILRNEPEQRVGQSWARSLLNSHMLIALTPEIPLPAESGLSTFSPNGESLLTVEQDGGIKLWSTSGASNRPVFQFQRQPPIAAVAFTLDSVWIGIAAVDGLHIRKAASHSDSDDLTLPSTGHALALAFSPDSKLAACGTADGEVMVVNLDEMKLAWRRIGHSAGVLSLAWNPGSDRLASGAADGVIKVWSAEASPQLFATSAGAGVVKMAWAADSSLLAFGRETGEVEICNPAGAGTIRTLRKHKGKVTNLYFDLTEPKLLSAGADGFVRLSSLEYQKTSPIKTFHVSRKSPRISISDDGHFTAGITSDGFGAVFHTESGAIAMPPIVQEGSVRDCLISPTRTRLTTISGANKMRLWQVPPAIDLKRTVISETGIINAIFCGLRNPFVATLDENGSVSLWRIPRDHVPGKGWHSDWSLPIKATGLAASPCGRWLCAWGTGEAMVWSLDSSAATARRLENDLQVSKAAFNSSGDHVVFMNTSGRIVIHEVAGGKKVGEISENEKTLEAALAPRAEWLITSHTNGKLKMWETLSGRLTATVSLGEMSITCLALSLDGAIIAVGSETGLVQTFESTGLRPTGRQIRYTSGISALKFAPGDDSLLICLQDGSARIKNWKVSADNEEVYMHSEGNPGAQLLIWSSSDEAQLTLATYGLDRVVRLWDRPSGLLLRPSLVQRTKRYPASVSENMEWLLIMAGSNQRITILSLKEPLQARHEELPWLADLLEDISGYQLTEEGDFKWRPPLDLHQLHAKYPLSKLQDRSWLTFGLRQP